MNIVFKELKHYGAMPHKTRVLVASFALRSIASPLFSLFINSFIWRSTSSFSNVAIYNLGFFVFLPLGFLVNGLLLRRMRITVLHLIALFISTITVLLVVFFSGTHTWHFLVYGLLYGFGSGIYWANRNYLSYQETKKEQRNYYFSIISVIESLIVLVATFFTGWAIEFGDYTDLYTPTTAYWVFSVLASIILILSGLIILKTDFKSPKVGKIIQLKISKSWNRIRLMNFSLGVREGLSFYLPTLLVLFYLGEEGTLGLISSVVILLTAVMTYLYGRFAKNSHRRPTFFVSAILYILVACLLFVLPEPYNILAFVLLIGLPNAFQWLVMNPLWVDLVSKEADKLVDSKYTLIFDREVFLNVGRIVSVFTLFFLIKITSEQMGLFLAPLILGIIQLILMTFIWRKKTFVF